MHDSKLRGGYRVVGVDNVNGKPHQWFFGDLATAAIFAEQQCRETRHETEIYEYIGRWVIAEPQGVRNG